MTACKNCDKKAEKPRLRGGEQGEPSVDELAHEEWLKKYDESFQDVKAVHEEGRGSGVNPLEERYSKIWVQEEDDMVKRLWEEGKRSSEISDELIAKGFLRTRLAVHKRAHTLGLRTTLHSHQQNEADRKEGTE